MKICITCKITDAMRKSSYCRSCASGYEKLRLATMPAAEKAKLRTKANARYNPVKRFEDGLKKRQISKEQFDKLLVGQNGSCAICLIKTDKLHIDHDHECCGSYKTMCGKCVRGLLCSNCNNGLGRFKDNPIFLVSASRYLVRSATK